MANEQTHRFHQVVDSAHHGLLAYIQSRIPSLEESEDLLQDVYVSALSSLNVLNTIDNLTGWLYTATKHKIIDWYRKKRLPTVSIDIPDENGIRFADILAAEMADISDEETRELVYQIITEAIDRLPDDQKYVVIQQVIEGRTFRELAEETGESINTLIARKRYAIRHLQMELRNIKKLLTGN